MHLMLMLPFVLLHDVKQVEIDMYYSIVKDSSADLGVNSKIVQNRPTVKAVSTKISKFFFLHICQYFCISERK